MSRTAVVTGASSGIGEACALRLDRSGWRVFAGVRSEDAAAALRERASERLAAVRLDVTDGQSIAEAAERVAASVGEPGLAGLVNNAGVGLASPLEFTPPEELRRVLDVNVVAQLAVTQAFIPLLRAARGRIVNMGSIGGRSVVPLLGAYSASKSALWALTDALRIELRPWGIFVSIVEPGAVSTPIWRKGREASDELLAGAPAAADELYGRLIEAIRRGAGVMERTGVPPDDVAKIVEHALTARRPKTRYLVGREARVRAALELLPDRLRDRIVLAQLRAVR